MRLIIVSIIASLFLYSNETDRIESILNDIEKLRKDNNKCQVELNSRNYSKDLQKCKVLLLKEEEKSSNYLAKIKKLNTEIVDIKKSCSKNQKSNKISSELSINKENEYKNLINKYKSEIKTKDDMIKSLKNQISLMGNNNVSKEKNPTIKSSVEKIEKIKASTFRLTTDSNIYDSINGNIVDKWEEKSSFTSSIATQNWIKITGYFVDKKWQRTDKEWWIKKINVEKK